MDFNIVDKKGTKLEIGKIVFDENSLLVYEVNFRKGCVILDSIDFIHEYDGDDYVKFSRVNDSFDETVIEYLQDIKNKKGEWVLMEDLKITEFDHVDDFYGSFDDPELLRAVLEKNQIN